MHYTYTFLWIANKCITQEATCLVCWLMRCGCDCSLFLLFLVRLLAGLFFFWEFSLLSGVVIDVAVHMFLFDESPQNVLMMPLGLMEAILRRRKAKRKKRRKKRERNGKSERKKRGGWGSRIGFGESWCIHGLFLTHSGRCLENEASHILTWVKLDWWLDTWFSCSPLGGNDLSWGALSSMFSDGLKQPRTTLPNISQLGKRKIIFKTILGGDMLVVKRERIYCWPIEKNLIDFPSWTFQSWKIWGFAWLILSFWAISAAVGAVLNLIPATLSQWLTFTPPED